MAMKYLVGRENQDLVWRIVLKCHTKFAGSKGTRVLSAWWLSDSD